MLCREKSKCLRVQRSLNPEAFIASVLGAKSACQSYANLLYLKVQGVESP